MREVEAAGICMAPDYNLAFLPDLFSSLEPLNSTLTIPDAGESLSVARAISANGQFIVGDYFVGSVDLEIGHSEFPDYNTVTRTFSRVGGFVLSALSELARINPDIGLSLNLRSVEDSGRNITANLIKTPSGGIDSQYYRYGPI